MDQDTSNQSSQSQPNIHEPFTRAERLQQLAEIDRDITALLTHTGSALQPLSRPTPQPDAQIAAFKTAQDAFLSTLHSVDVRLKRQIMGLEEAGIISLKEPGKGGASSLEPNGVGKIGKLDVGWLNSRSSKVEREMEAEQWGRARELLEGRAGEERVGDGVKDEDVDVKMEED